jgi:hypothetical protein
MCRSLAAEAGLTAGRLLPLILLPTPPFVLPPQICRGTLWQSRWYGGLKPPPAAGSAAAAAQRLLKQAPVFLN